MVLGGRAARRGGPARLRRVRPCRGRAVQRRSRRGGDAGRRAAARAGAAAARGRRGRHVRRRPPPRARRSSPAPRRCCAASGRCGPSAAARSSSPGSRPAACTAGSRPASSRGTGIRARCSSPRPVARRVSPGRGTSRRPARRSPWNSRPRCVYLSLGDRDARPDVGDDLRGAAVAGRRGRRAARHRGVRAPHGRLRHHLHDLGPGHRGRPDRGDRARRPLHRRAARARQDGPVRARGSGRARALRVRRLAHGQRVGLLPAGPARQRRLRDRVPDLDPRALAAARDHRRDAAGQEDGMAQRPRRGAPLQPGELGLGRPVLAPARGPAPALLRRRADRARRRADRHGRAPVRGGDLALLAHPAPARGPGAAA